MIILHLILHWSYLDKKDLYRPLYTMNTWLFIPNCKSKNKKETTTIYKKEPREENNNKITKLKLNTKSFMIITPPSLLDLKMTNHTRNINWIVDVYNLLSIIPKIETIYGGIARNYKRYYYIQLSKLQSKSRIKEFIKNADIFKQVEYTFRPRKIWAVTKVKSLIENPLIFPGHKIKLKCG